MAPPVEAYSLSEITQLASNVPKYPRNPTEKKREPLTLYIARVPGSRDVILSTLRPNLKNVTATDIASSLYYFHLNTEEDTQLLRESETAIVEEDEPSEVIQKPLLRKPLPESARTSLDLNRQVAPASTSVLGSSPEKAKIGRKPLPADYHNIVQSRLEPEGEVTRRPLGPRPFLSEANTARKPLDGSENLPLRREDLRTSLDASRQEISHMTSPNLKGASGRCFSITVIRRDPSSGAQWNIGTVSGEELIQEPAKSSHSKKPYFDMAVNLTTPAYTSFRATNTGSAAKTSVSLSTLFERHIKMEGVSFWDRSKQHRRTQSDVAKTPGRKEEAESPDHSLLGVSDRISGPRESKTKGYVFTSPWNGRCKFSTSGSGRSLRCQHTLPGPVSARPTGDDGSVSQISVTLSELRFNLPSSVLFRSPIPPNNASKSRGAELGRKFDQFRDKLADRNRPPLPPRPQSHSQPHPGSYAAMYPSDDEAPPLPPRPENSKPSEESREIFLQETNTVPPHSHITTSASEEEESPLDLTLGQEKAGGGNRGKRVKLGKLIIFDEGYKMMDLIVVANMAVWWSVWESTASS